MSVDPVLSVRPLGFPWETVDPFLFCAYHDDDYPAGNGALGPAASLLGRQLGQDFEPKDGWRMYHGQSVPGFPSHPHRGFETVTLVRKGLCDHSDSLGATARFGRGDVQWITTGRGIVHAEMFPLVDTSRRNPLELFQIWLNLPAANKLVPPHFKVFWADSVPRVATADEAGRVTETTVVAGRLGERAPPAPPPDSWAAHPESDVAIWTVRLAAGARHRLPPAAAGSNRVLYFFRGGGMSVGGRKVAAPCAVRVAGTAELALEAGGEECELLMLQGRPLNEPVAQYGPFVMNTREQLQQAVVDYQRTQYGGWPWDSDAPVHPADAGRFARFPDGHTERAG